MSLCCNAECYLLDPLLAFYLAQLDFSQLQSVCYLWWYTIAHNALIMHNSHSWIWWCTYPMMRMRTQRLTNAHSCRYTHMLADGRCTYAHINAHDKFPHLVRWQRNDPATVISRIPRAAINHPEKWYLGLSFLHNSVLGAQLKQLWPTGGCKIDQCVMVMMFVWWDTVTECISVWPHCICIWNNAKGTMDPRH